ncbi:MAG: hypothetical protein QM770_02295 [Tepidisphaeraceae bacterium]
MRLPFDLVKRLVAVCVRRQASVVEMLGGGKDGDVFRTDAGTAVKLFASEEVYRRERDVYFRIRDNKVTVIAGFAVPQFISNHDDVWALEMTIVRPPFVLDFASAWLDDAPEYSEDVMQHWFDEIHEKFEARASVVFDLIDRFRDEHGIHLLDIHPGNIKSRGE